MKISIKMIAVLVLGGCAAEEATLPQRLPSAAKPLKSSLKDVLLSRKRILENGNTTHSPNGDSWSFRPDGTFKVAALTGQKSWSAEGTWAELSSGAIALNGVERNERYPNAVFTSSKYKRTIAGYSIVEETDDNIIVRFIILGEILKNAENEGK